MCVPNEETSITYMLVWGFFSRFYRLFLMPCWVLLCRIFNPSGVEHSLFLHPIFTVLLQSQPFLVRLCIHVKPSSVLIQNSNSNAMLSDWCVFITTITLGFVGLTQQPLINLRKTWREFENFRQCRGVPNKVATEFRSKGRNKEKEAQSKVNRSS